MKIFKTKWVVVKDNIVVKVCQTKEEAESVAALDDSGKSEIVKWNPLDHIAWLDWLVPAAMIAWFIISILIFFKIW